jgi:drug/metabolite transporter (DMT)-like permease
VFGVGGRGRSGVALLVAVTVIWGTTFPLVKTLGETLAPPTIVSVRFLLAALVLSPWLRFADRRMVRDGIVLGSMTFVSYAAQTIGLRTVTGGRAAFVTGLNVIMVPLALPLLGRRVHRLVFVAATMALTGIALLSWDTGALRFSIGDVWMVLCAATYAAYVLLLEAFAPHHAVRPFAAVQVLVVGSCAAIWFLVDAPTRGLRTLRHADAETWITIAFLGIVAVAITTMLQTAAQRTVRAPTAAVVYSLEPVFGAIASYLWRDERLAPLGFVGAALVVGAMILSQRVDAVAPPGPAVLTTS